MTFNSSATCFLIIIRSRSTPVAISKSYIYKGRAIDNISIALSLAHVFAKLMLFTTSLGVIITIINNQPIYIQIASEFN